MKKEFRCLQLHAEKAAMTAAVMEGIVGKCIEKFSRLGNRPMQMPRV